MRIAYNSLHIPGRVRCGDGETAEERCNQNGHTRKACVKADRGKLLV